MWFCAHTPRSGLVGLSSQPAIVQMLPSVSVHGVLTFAVHCPLALSKPPLHSSTAFDGFVMRLWSPTPAPLQPAVEHAPPRPNGPAVRPVPKAGASPLTP